MKYVYANLGRGTALQAKRSWHSLGVAAAEADAAVFVEVDEGDTGYSDHDFIRQFFRGFQQKFMRRMTVILVASKHRVQGARSTFSGDGVKRWSPVRYVNEIRVLPPAGKQEPATTIIGVHYAAGYHNGTRPKWAVPLLGVSWHLTHKVHRARVRAAHERADHVVSFFDANDHDFHETFLHRDAVRVFHDVSDYGVAVPAHGWHVRAVTHDTVQTFIEKAHTGHLVAVRFAEGPSTAR